MTGVIWGALFCGQLAEDVLQDAAVLVILDLLRRVDAEFSTARFRERRGHGKFCGRGGRRPQCDVGLLRFGRSSGWTTENELHLRA